ncbi:hypothetical protein NLU13_7790 [Sarocladium strictum]|uniref:Fungal lipase-type domain-containing protein n=1 Tax=Sarocladium strictum TaxID=5046 RepID=A0AA39GEY6_SARSR|nr:hypothetical protein NLU13_7790 [Sarocladium strictum]
MAPRYTYNVWQQIYSLSAASNLVAAKIATEADLQAAMEKALDKKLPTINGDWQVSWGPRVYKPNPEKKGPVENVWFAAVSEEQKLIVVAVAGTAPPSIRDWFDDFDVARVVNFDNWVASWNNNNGVPKPEVDKTPDTLSHAYCANGTATGVYNILSNKAAASDTYLWQYLQGVTPDYTVVFTGHSMGGALSPTLALGLRRANMIGAAGRDVKAYTMPSAGPTPGNAQFVAAYEQAYPFTRGDPAAPDYGAYNGDLFNTNDIVPQAWSVVPTDDRNLGRITGGIYTFARLDGSWKLYATAALLTGLAIRRSGSSKIRYQPIAPNAFTATDSLPKVVDSAAVLATSIVRNHTFSYWNHIAIDGFVTEFNDHVVAQPGVDEPPTDAAALGVDMDAESFDPVPESDLE